MGFAMIGVLIDHIIVFGGLNFNTWASFLEFIAVLLHTPGFLFLSGFGIYYSLSKDSNFCNFYQRRFYRFYFPFLCYALPFYGAFLIFKHENIWFLIRCLTTIEFWINGNYGGMWYIAASMFLYILSPLIFRIVHFKQKYVIVSLLVFLLLFCLVDYLLLTFAPGYYGIVKIGVSKFPYYILGFIFAHLSLSSPNKYTRIVVYVALTVGVISWGIASRNIYVSILRFVSNIILLSTLFVFTKDYVKVRLNSFFVWFGTYSLELYILHLYIGGVLGVVFHINGVYNILIAVMMSIILCTPAHKITDYLSLKLKKIL